MSSSFYICTLLSLLMTFSCHSLSLSLSFFLFLLVMLIIVITVITSEIQLRSFLRHFWSPSGWTSRHSIDTRAQHIGSNMIETICVRITENSKSHEKLAQLSHLKLNRKFFDDKKMSHGLANHLFRINIYILYTSPDRLVVPAQSYLYTREKQCLVDVCYSGTIYMCNFFLNSNLTNKQKFVYFSIAEKLGTDMAKSLWIWWSDE